MKLVTYWLLTSLHFYPCQTESSNVASCDVTWFDQGSKSASDNGYTFRTEKECLEQAYTFARSSSLLPPLPKGERIVRGCEKHTLEFPDDYKKDVK